MRNSNSKTYSTVLVTLIINCRIIQFQFLLSSAPLPGDDSTELSSFKNVIPYYDSINFLGIQL